MSNKIRRLTDWIEDMHFAIANIKSDIGPLTQEDFLKDGKTVRAVAKSVSDIGEASNQIMRIAPGLQQSNPAAWEHLREVYAMRNVLSHGYFRTDAEIIWATVTEELPKLASLLRDMSAFNN